MTIQIGPPGPDPTPMDKRPLDVICFSRPVFRIVRYAMNHGDNCRGFVNLPETFRNMVPDRDILLVKSRWGKDQPQVHAAARKANVRLEIQSRPLADDLLVTVLGPKEKKVKAPAKPKEPAPPKTPRTRCFGAMRPVDAQQRLRDLLS